MFRVCRYCGCSELDPCIDERGNACEWVAPDACSSCVDLAEAITFAAEDAEEENGLPGQDDEPLVQLYTEGEANAVIRAMRAGGAL